MTREQLKQLEADLWSAADNLRANSDLKSSEYSTPVLGLIFLKFADNNYRRHEAEILAEYKKLQGTRREKEISEIAVESSGYLKSLALKPFIHHGANGAIIIHQQNSVCIPWFGRSHTAPASRHEQWQFIT
jgi:hypothetical protein